MALSALPRHCKHHVFPSFHGKDVRRGFLSCLLKEFKEKGIDVFIDNDLERSKLIGPKLTEAIRGSLIAILLISRNYASSTWCLNELVEIMKCREEDKQTVEVIFYEVDPSDVKKQKGDFGAVFQKTCAEKSTEEVERWRQALQIVTQIAGYHTSNLMDQPPSFPHYQSRIPNFFHRAPLPLNSNPNFFHRSPPPPLQTPNTYSIPPSPPPIRELSGTLSSLQSLISECQRTLDSLSQNLSLDHSSLLHKDGLVRCPFDPNHLMPPEALVLHSLRCPSTLDLTPLLGSFSSYRNTLELPCEPELNNGDGDLCFSLDDVTDFFYNDCPGAVNFSDLDGKTRRFTLPTVLSVECSELEGSSVLEKSLFV